MKLVFKHWMVLRVHKIFFLFNGWETLDRQWANQRESRHHNCVPSSGMWFKYWNYPNIHQFLLSSACIYTTAKWHFGKQQLLFIFFSRHFLFKTKYTWLNRNLYMTNADITQHTSFRASFSTSVFVFIRFGIWIFNVVLHYIFMGLQK